MVRYSRCLLPSVRRNYNYNHCHPTTDLWHLWSVTCRLWPFSCTLFLFVTRDLFFFPRRTASGRAVRGPLAATRAARWTTRDRSRRARHRPSPGPVTATKTPRTCPGPAGCTPPRPPRFRRATSPATRPPTRTPRARACRGTTQMPRSTAARSTRAPHCPHREGSTPPRRRRVKAGTCIDRVRC